MEVGEKVVGVEKEAVEDKNGEELDEFTGALDQGEEREQIADHAEKRDTDDDQAQRQLDIGVDELQGRKVRMKGNGLAFENAREVEWRGHR